MQDQRGRVLAQQACGQMAHHHLLIVENCNFDICGRGDCELYLDPVALGTCCGLLGESDFVCAHECVAGSTSNHHYCK